MSRTSVTSLRYYDEAVTDLIVQKYNLGRMDALRRFVMSQTHAWLEDAEYGLLSFGAPGIFDMWENEAVTGTPTNSVYLGGDQDVQRD